MLRVSTALAGSGPEGAFGVSVLWGLLVWKAGASPGARNTFPGEQVGGWCSGAAAAAFPCPWHQIHSRRLGESQLWSLNADAALPEQKRALSADQCNQKTRRVSRGWDGPGGGERRTRPGADLHLPCPAPQGLGKAPRSAHRLCLLWPNLATVSAPGAQGLFQLRAISV